jgi:hypothetical protein
MSREDQAMKKALLLTIVMLCGFLTLPASAAEASTTVSHILVRVTQLNAIGPDGQSYTLYRDDAGQLMPVKDLGRIAYYVKAGSLPEGGYHTLSVRLTGEATVIYSDGHQESRSLKAMSVPVERRISGMLWIEAGNVTPMRVGPRRDPAHLRYEYDDD